MLHQQRRHLLGRHVRRAARAGLAGAHAPLCSRQQRVVQHVARDEAPRAASDARAAGLCALLLRPREASAAAGGVSRLPRARRERVQQDALQRRDAAGRVAGSVLIRRGRGVCVVVTGACRDWWAGTRASARAVGIRAQNTASCLCAAGGGIFSHTHAAACVAPRRLRVRCRSSASTRLATSSTQAASCSACNRRMAMCSSRQLLRPVPHPALWKAEEDHHATQACASARAAQRSSPPGLPGTGRGRARRSGRRTAP